MCASLATLSHTFTQNVRDSRHDLSFSIHPPASPSDLRDYMFKKNKPFVYSEQGLVSHCMLLSHSQPIRLTDPRPPPAEAHVCWAAT